MIAQHVRAFVAGATGYTGREVVRVLRDRGAAVVAHIRPDSPSLERARVRFERLGAATDSTAWALDRIAETLARTEPTHIFALLGITRERARRRARAGAPAESYASVDYGLSSLLLHGAKRSTPGARFVYLSALAASETSGNEYLRVRGRVEREIRESGLSAMIVRPSFITGPDREESRLAERAAAVVADGGLRLAGWLGARTVERRFRSRTAAELAEQMVTLALADRSGVQVVDGVDLDRATAPHDERPGIT